MMFDIRAWIWFALRLFMYSIVVFVVVIGLISVFALGYYWFVIRPRRARNQLEIKTKFSNRSFSFHTLTVHITNRGTILLNIRLSQLEKHPIEFGQLNVQRYPISDVTIRDEQIDIIFADANNIQLTIRHENIEQRRYERRTSSICMLLFFILVLKLNEIILFMTTHSLGQRRIIEHDSSINSIFMTRVTGMAERPNEQSTGRLINLLPNVKP